MIVYVISKSEIIVLVHGENMDFRHFLQFLAFYFYVLFLTLSF